MVALLQGSPSLITTCTLGGQLQDTPLTGMHVQAMWPCTAGLLLEVRGTSGHWVVGRMLLASAARHKGDVAVMSLTSLLSAPHAVALIALPAHCQPHCAPHPCPATA